MTTEMEVWKANQDLYAKRFEVIMRQLYIIEDRLDIIELRVEDLK